MSDPSLVRKPQKMPKQIEKFCQLVAIGYRKAEAYRGAYPKCKQVNAFRLMQREDVVKRIEVLKDVHFRANALSDAEKRDYLARAVRTPLAEITEQSDLAQKVIREVRPDKEGDRAGEDSVTIVKIESVNRLAAIAEDNKMAGSYFSDQQQAKAPGFSFLIDFAKYLESGMKPVLSVEDKNEMLTG